MPPEKFPCCVLFITINPSRVDVNVHPAKLEVKFSNEKPVFEAIYYTVRTALESNSARPSMQLDVSNRAKRASFAGRASDAQVPVRDGKAESLQSRQLSYDIEGRMQHQPQIRMTAAEYRDTYAQTDAKSVGSSRAPKLPQNDEPLILGTRGNQPTVTVNETPKPQEIPPREFPTMPTESPAVTQKPIQEEAIAPVKTEPPVAPLPKIEQTIATEPPKTEVPSPPLPSEASVEPPAAETVHEVPPYRIVGEVFNSYVIVETGDKMLLVDKHAAHERILFEQLKAGLRDVAVVSQLLMLPVDVMMTSAEVEALKEYCDELEKIGFALRFARNTVSADAIPESVDPNAVADMLGSMAGRILNATGSVKLTRDIIFEKALYQAACKAAIKAGRAYADEHIKWIVDKLMTIPDITFCPHGRPVALELSHHMLDKQFDRTGF